MLAGLLFLQNGRPAVYVNDRRGLLTLVLAIAYCLAATATGYGANSTNPFPPQFQDRTLFADAIADAEKKALVPRKLTGITVPHHVVAIDLIAMAFQMVDPGAIDKVVVLFPDHFKRARLPFATSRRAFETVFGPIEAGLPEIRLLLRARGLVEESNLFADDHGIGAVLPFIKHRLPSARIVPVAVSVDARKADLDRLVAQLRRIVGSGTLIVQSSDFSHDLPHGAAVQRDQEVLNVLAAGRIDAVGRLRQPQHTDSRGAQYLQMRLQQEHFRAQPIVVFNSNSQTYAGLRVARTTSYIVQLFDPQPPRSVGDPMPGSKLYCFAGNTIFGRGMLKILSQPGEADRVLGDMRAVLRNCPLVLNLTGVVLPELPLGLDPLTLAMPAGLTVEWLKALNVIAVNLANNHAMDLGREPFEAMDKLLGDAGVRVLKHGSIVDLGPFRLGALTDNDNWSRRGAGVVTDADIARIARSNAAPPLFVMLSWGPENAVRPGLRELALVEALRKSAVSLVAGVRPHRAAASVDLLDGNQGLSVHSLGNFLFDQGSHLGSGAVLEVRLFEQGTYFARLIPTPNFFADSSRRRGLN